MRGAKQTEMFEILRKREILHLRSVCPPGVCVCVCVCVGGGGGGYSDIFIHMFEFHYFWGFQKTEYLLGFEDFVHIVWDHHKIGLSRYRLEDIFWVAQILKIYWGA